MLTSSDCAGFDAMMLQHCRPAVATQLLDCTVVPISLGVSVRLFRLSVTMKVLHNHLPTMQRIVGVVVSVGMDRTAVVAVQRYFLHPRTRKLMRHVSKFFAHDHHEVCGVGDRVHIEHWGPISLKKSHTVVDIIQRHPQLEGEPFPMSRLRHPPREAAALTAEAEQRLV